MAKKKINKNPVSKAGVFKAKISKREIDEIQREIEREFINFELKQPKQNAKSRKPNKERPKQNSKGNAKVLETKRGKIESGVSGNRDEHNDVRRVFKGEKRIVKAEPIVYNEKEIKRLRGLKKKDGTEYSERYYKSLLKKIQGKTQDEVDDVLIKLRNNNPNVRYFIESKAPTLHFQTGNFIDRISGDEKTLRIAKKSGKQRKQKMRLEGDFKKGSTVTIRDFKGDDHEFKSVKKANEMLAEQNRIINKVLGRLEKDANLKKGKSLGVYVTVPEKVTANSEREITNVTYNFEEYKVQGIEGAKFKLYLGDEIDN